MTEKYIHYIFTTAEQSKRKQKKNPIYYYHANNLQVRFDQIIILLEIIKGVMMP